MLIYKCFRYIYMVFDYIIYYYDINDIIDI